MQERFNFGRTSPLKFISILLIPILIIVGIILCIKFQGNKQLFDVTNDFEYAIVSYPDGTSGIIEIQSWKDFDGEQIQIKAKDGKTYLFHASNCVLVDED